MDAAGIFSKDAGKQPDLKLGIGSTHSSDKQKSETSSGIKRVSSRISTIKPSVPKIDPLRRQIDRLELDLNLSLSDDPDFQHKIAFLEKIIHIDKNALKHLRLLNKYSRQIPLLTQSLKILQDYFQQWENEGQGQPVLQEKIVRLYTNMLHISQTLQEVLVEVAYVDSPHLTQLPIHQDLLPFIKGDVEFNENSLKHLGVILTDSLKEMQKEIGGLKEEHQTTKLHERREKERISLRILEVSSGLFHTCRKALSEIASLEKLDNSSLEKHSNSVVPIVTYPEIAENLTQDQAGKLLKDNEWVLSTYPNNNQWALLTFMKGKIVQVPLIRTSDPQVFKEKNGERVTLSEIKHRMNTAGCQNYKSRILGYYKRGQGPDYDQNISIMETFAWNVANILGLQDQFVETKLIDVRPYYLMQPSKKENAERSNEVIFNAAGSAVETKKALSGLRGSFQPHQEGEIFEKAYSLCSRQQIAKATMTAIIFGMNDAHSANSIVKPNGEIKFFDNSRSFSSDDEYLNRGYEKILSSFRVCFFISEKMFEPLSKDERLQMLKELDDVRNRMHDLHDYFNNRQIKKLIQKLPPGWLNLKTALVAMERRVSKLQTALESDKVISLRDIVFSVYPRLRFNAGYLALTLMNIRNPSFPFVFDDPTKYRKDQWITFQSKCLFSIGYRSLNHLLDEGVQKYGYNPETIERICQAADFDQMLAQLAVFFVTHNEIPDPKKLKEKSRNIINQLEQTSPIDFMDRSTGYSISSAQRVTKHALERASIPIVSSSDYILVKETMEKLAKNNYMITEFAATKQSDAYYDIRLKRDDELQSYYIDCHTYPGKIIIRINKGELPPMTPEEIRQWCDPNGKDLPLVRQTEKVLGLISKQFKTQINTSAQAFQLARNLNVGDYFISQIRGSEYPEYRLYVKTGVENVERIGLDFHTQLGSVILKDGKELLELTLGELQVYIKNLIQIAPSQQDKIQSQTEQKTKPSP